MNLRNRLIWIALLTVVVASVQWVATRRKADHELVDYLKDKLAPVVNACVPPSTRGTLTLELRVVPNGKLDANIDSAEVPARSEVQGKELAACIRGRAAAVALKYPLPGPQHVELELPVTRDESTPR